MNLNTLFTKQKLLDEHIVNEKGLHGQDLLKKKTVALICELYECVNEARFFKFWSEKQKPSGIIYQTTNGNDFDYFFCAHCSQKINKEETILYTPDEFCGRCDTELHRMKYKNPLLEEYADVIHFALSIANDTGYTEHKYIHTEGTDLNDLVLGITSVATIIPQSRSKRHISTLINNVIQLGYQLGFTEDDVLNAYEDKNKENHKRQEVGY